jgi:hypothetical protein
MLFGSEHISFEQLLDLIEGRLSPDDEARARAHLAACPHCTTELASTHRLVNTMRADELEDAPPHVIARAVRLMRPAPSQPSLLRRVLATLAFDSAQVQPSFGLRSGTPTARQMLFNADTHDLDVRITPINDHWFVTGQVLGPGADGRVELRGPATVQTTLNELSEFSLPLVPTGTYTLSVTLGDMAIEIPDLELGR